VAYQKIVAVFDSADRGKQALDALARAGFASDDVHTLTRDEVNRIAPDAHTVVRQAGFWHRLLGDDVVEYEGEVYGRAIDNGGTVITLRVVDVDADKATALLHDLGPVDIEHRASELGLVQAAVQKPPAVAAAAVAPVAAKIAATPASTVATDQVLRLAEEQLQVGKQQVAAGTTTVRRYVVDKPVEEQVTLHEEHADVVRRAVKDPNYVGDIDWNDQTIVVTETAERAVVNKVARISEEVVVRREGSDKVETIRDTVRQQKVDVGHTTTVDDKLKT